MGGLEFKSMPVECFEDNALLDIAMLFKSSQLFLLFGGKITKHGSLLRIHVVFIYMKVKLLTPLYFFLNKESHRKIFKIFPTLCLQRHLIPKTKT